MAAEEDAPKEAEGPRPIPAWVMTFADLMSLLMCFFVLLLAFSEMDAKKYKQLSGSMESAFGVQRDVKAHEIPKGISIIATEFSAGRPDPTPLNEVRQRTTNDRHKFVDVGQDKQKDGQGKKQDDNEGDGAADEDGQKQMSSSREQDPAASVEFETELGATELLDDAATEIRGQLEYELQQELVEVELQGGNRVVIRIREKGSFSAGSAALQRSFVPVINKIRDTLLKIPGKVEIAGHTDDRPNTSRKIRSNWELSTARAIAVAHELLSGGGEDSIDPARVEIRGHASTRPLVPNDSEKNRARNRRVEISIVQGKEKNTDISKYLKQKALGR